MTPAAKARRVRLAVTLKSGTILVYTWPFHRHEMMIHRWRRKTRLQLADIAENSFALHIMQEGYYQDHKPTGDVRHVVAGREPLSVLQGAV